MKKLILLGLAVLLLAPAAPMLAQHGGHGGGGHGGGHGGGGWHGGHGGGGWHGGGWHGGSGWHGGGWWGPRWGWGWYAPYGWWGYSGWYGYPGYGYYGYPYSGYGYAAAVPGAWAIIKTDIDPEEARLFLDGNYIGTADDFDGNPDYLYLERGHYKLEFRLDGFETKEYDIDARVGTMTKLDDKMKKIPGAKQYGSYDTPAVPGGIQRFFGKKNGATVAEPDGSQEGAPNGYSGSPDATMDQAPPPQRNHTPQAAPPPDNSNGDSWRDREGASASPSVRPSRIRIQVGPPDAAVYLDDRFLGTADDLSQQLQGLKVSPGHHVVTISRPGYRDRAVEVNVEPGHTETVDLELER